MINKNYIAFNYGEITVELLEKLYNSYGISCEFDGDLNASNTIFSGINI